MRLTLAQLPQNLLKQLQPIYFLSGDEPLQLNEAADAVRQAARSVGFIEREILTVDNHFDWSSLFSLAVSNSIFSEKKILDFRIPEAKLGVEGGKALQAYCKNIPKETLLLITSGKLAKDAYKSRWFESLDHNGVIIQTKALEGKELEQWLNHRARARNMSISPPAIKRLVEKLEGNLLAAAQEIEKLYVLFGSALIDETIIDEVVSDSSRFDVFKLVDAALAGQIKRCLKILHRLKNEGVAVPIVLWALTREARTLLGLLQTPKSSHQPNYYASEKHNNIRTDALKRIKRPTLEQVLLLGATVDRQTKGQQSGDPWETLTRICLLLTPAADFLAEF